MLLISLITIGRTLGLGETPRGLLSTSETDGTRSYKYQSAISHVCIGNSRVTNTRSPPVSPSTAPPRLSRPFAPPRQVLFKRFVPLLRAHLHRQLRRRTLRRKLERMGGGKRNGVTNARVALLNNPCPLICTRRVCVRGKSFSTVGKVKNKKI